MKHQFFAFLFLLFAVPAFAAHVAVLETMADPTAKDKVKLSDRQYLTNVLREEAVKQLPADKEKAKAKIAELKEKAGAKYFKKDHTHTSKLGAQLNAQSFAKGLKQTGSELAKYLKK